MQGFLPAAKAFAKTGIDKATDFLETAMVQRLHLVFGGELEDPTKNNFKDVDAIDVVGIFPNYATAYDAWKAAAQRTVDNAHMRYYIAHLHRLRDEEREASATEELG